MQPISIIMWRDGGTRYSGSRQGPPGRHIFEGLSQNRIFSLALAADIRQQVRATQPMTIFIRLSLDDPGVHPRIGVGPRSATLQRDSDGQC